MKKILIVLGLVTATIFSCTEKKEEQIVDQSEKAIEMTQEEPSDIVEGVVKHSAVKWTGFKTSEKLAVSGIFDAVQVTNTNEGKTPEEVLQGAKVRVAVSSINSGLEERDSRLKMIFFGAMANTSDIYGDINFRSGKTYINFTFNNTSKEYEVQSNFASNIFTIKTTINLADFNALPAIDALNQACGDLHKGADGVSKTWSEVEIEGTITFSDSFGK